MKRAIDGSLASYVTHLEVRDEIISRAPVTLSLAVGTTVIAVVLVLLVGVLSAAWAGRTGDRILALLSLGAMSIPTVWLLVELQYWLTEQVEVFPVGGWVPFVDDPRGWLKHALLPCFVSALPLVGVSGRLLRATMLDALQEDYVKTARAKGVPWRTIWTSHILRNGLLPVVSTVGLDFAGMAAGGLILTETVFDIPGVGQYAAQSVAALDLPPLIGVTLYAAATVVVLNTVVDLIYVWVDPRVRVTR
jgi:peptide/nickel transport system permease protein